MHYYYSVNSCNPGIYTESYSINHKMTLNGCEPSIVIEKRIEIPNINLKYPEVNGLVSNEAERKINDLIMDYTGEIIEMQMGAWQNLDNIKIQSGYEVMLNKNDVLSLTLIHFAYQNNVSQGYTFQKALNFDLTNGELLTLDKIFKDSLALEDFITYFKAALAKEISTTIKEIDCNQFNQQFYFTEDYLVIYFQQDEYTPYEFGLPEFYVSYQAISDLIAKEGPVGKLLENKFQINV